MAWLQLRGKLARMVLISQMLLLVHTLPLQAEQPEQDRNNAGPAVRLEEAGAKAESREGIATYYARHYKGRRTSSGTRYRPEKLTAAHPDLPFGTKVRVTNLANGKEVVVVVIDRCRQRKSPTIDLSRAAAKKLGFLGKGRARVLMARVDEGQS